MWPLQRHQSEHNPAFLKWIPKERIELTKEEQDEVQKGFDQIHQAAGPGQRLAVRTEHAQLFQYSIAALALHLRAEELALRLRIDLSCPAAKRAEIAEMMLSAAGKACAFFPVPIYLYHLGCAMELADKTDEARATFRAFLKWQRELKPGDVQPFSPSDDTIPEAVAYAKQSVAA